MTLEELEAEAMKLDPPSRTELARRLTASLAATGQTPAAAPSPPPPTDEERERLWLQDALRRSRELRERQVQTEPPERKSVFRPPTREVTSKAKKRHRPARKPQAKRSAARRAKPARRRPARATRTAKRAKPAKARAKARAKPRSPRR